MLNLRNYVRTIIKESVLSSLSERFGILSVKGERGNGEDIWAVVLYDFEQAKEEFDEIISDRVIEEGDEVYSDDLIDAILYSTYSVMRLRPFNSSLTRSYSNTDRNKVGPCNNAWEVTRLASKERGYGWRINQLVMSVATNGTFPDRNSISTDAQHMYTSSATRKSYNVSKLDNIENPQTPDPSDDCVLWGHDRFPEESKIDYTHNLPYDSTWDSLIENTNTLIDYVDNHELKKSFNAATRWPDRIDFLSEIQDISEINEIVAQTFTEVYQIEEE
jgi:hypothetical protein